MAKLSRCRFDHPGHGTDREKTIMKPEERSAGSITTMTALSNPTPQEAKSIPWTALGKILVTAAAAAAAALHFIGQAAYSEWMDHWGFDSGQIPLDTSGRFHYGYMAVLETGNTLIGNWVAAGLLVFFIMLGLQFWVASLVKETSPENTKFGQWLRSVAGRAPRWLKSLFKAFGISGLIVAILYLTIAAAFIALVAAPAVGEHAANRWAARKEAKIAEGCQRRGRHAVCTQISNGGKVIGTGLLIASSPSHVAFFDIAAKRSRLVKVEDADMTGWVP
ncbi:MAG: hypothetical protein E6Q40_15130 [Cupriavidus sp.]|nr:MAG: hypothetical protein E6Q40_15130 [Cupriavidus sp.]